MAGKDFTQMIRSKLDAMEPKKREQVIKGVLGAAFVVVIIGLYYMSGADKKKPPPPKEEPSVIHLGDARLEDDIRASYEKSQLDSNARLSDQAKKQKEQDDQIAQQKAQLDAMQRAMETMASSPAPGLPNVAPPAGTAPNDPLAWQGTNAQTGTSRSGGAVHPGGAPEAPPPPVEYVGGVGSAKPQNAALAPADGSKKNTHKFFLPPSFMPAKLLTGLKAKTVESARGDPEPIMLRVQAPAILPNEVRAQLEGCLIVAHGYGSLASERVEARLVSISCLDYDGKSVIDSDLKGIVVDKDGVKGLAGHPVSKMGANLARLMLAGIAQGAGEAFQQSSTTTSISPLGQTSSIDPSQVSRAGIGKGVANAGNELARIYSELVRQSAPVIEVGPSKDVTAVVTEGAWLEIKDYEEGEHSQ